MIDDDRLQAALKTPLFPGMTPEQIRTFLALGTSRTYQPGEVILKEGETDQQAFVLLRGRLDITKLVPSPMGGTPEVRSLFKPAVPQMMALFPVGFVNLIARMGRSATITALDESDVLVISADDFDAACVNDPAMGYRLARNIALAMANDLVATGSRVTKLTQALGISHRYVDRAGTVQARMLPPEVPQWPGEVEIAVRLLPAMETSGDFYDVLELENRRGSDALQIAVGDVMGKGIEAALIMSMARSTLRAVARLEPDTPRVDRGGAPENATWSPATILRRAGAMLYEDLGREVGGREFVACALAIVERLGGDAAGDAHGARVRLRLANAGQVPPLLYREGAVTELTPTGASFPLGVVRDTPYEELTFDLLAGDTVMFVSDGVPEAPAHPPGSVPSLETTDWIDSFIAGVFNRGRPSGAGGELYGFERLAESAARHATTGLTAAAVADGLLDDLRAWSGPRTTTDDVTVVVLRVPAQFVSARWTPAP